MAILPIIWSVFCLGSRTLFSDQSQKNYLPCVVRIVRMKLSLHNHQAQFAGSSLYAWQLRLSDFSRFCFVLSLVCAWAWAQSSQADDILHKDGRLLSGQFGRLSKTAEEPMANPNPRHRNRSSCAMINYAAHSCQCDSCKRIPCKPKPTVRSRSPSNKPSKWSRTCRLFRTSAWRHAV